MTSTFERFGAVDTLFLSCESDTHPMHIGALCLLARGTSTSPPLSIAKLRRHVESRLDACPRYRQRIAHVPLEGHPVWVDAENFRIEDHVRAIALPAPQSHARLEETVSWIFSQPLCRARPLWEISLIEGLENGGAALVCKVHHSIADGLAAVALMTSIFGLEPFADAETAAPWTPRPSPGGSVLLSDAIAVRTRDAVGLALRTAKQFVATPSAILREAAHVGSTLRTLAGALLRPGVQTPFDAATGTGNRFLWWSTPLEDIRMIGHRLGGTVNDVVLAMIGDALSQICSQRRPDASVRVVCPVDVSDGASLSRLGNRVSGIFVDLPIGEQDPRERLQTVSEATRKGKDSGTIEGTFLFEEFINAVAPSLLCTLEKNFGNAAPYDLLVTNVPGPRIPLYLFEHRMTAVFPLVPLFRGKSLGIALFSYGDKLAWGFNVVASRADFVPRLRQALATALERFALLAETPLSRQARTPIQLPPESGIRFAIEEQPAEPETASAGDATVPWEGSYSVVRDLRADGD